jgi:salicylate hydroxylase
VLLTATRPVIIAGAGIGGLTAALALAQRGFRAVVLERAQQLEDTGAGIQLSPNAARVLIDLGLGDSLRPHAVAPTAVRVLSAASGREILRMPLADAETRYGAPYWVVHRGDLQAALTAATLRLPEITLRLDLHVDDVVTHVNGVSVSMTGAGSPPDERGMALIAADGLWSTLRRRLGHVDAPRFAGRIAWRGLVPAREVAPEFREPFVHLWLGRKAHLVHYPIKGGRIINIVAVTAVDGIEGANMQGWSEPASRAEILPRFAVEAWAPSARALIGLPDAWLKWPLFDRRPIRRWAKGPVALLGDAAHPMLPFMAQGGAMAIEDAAVVAYHLGRRPDNPDAALRAYARQRRGRTRRVQRAASRNSTIYHLSGLSGWARDVVMSAMGGRHLLGHYDWIFRWRPPE